MDSDVRDLERSGLTGETIRLAGLKTIDRAATTDLLGFDPRSGGLLFPYPPFGAADPFARVKLHVPLQLKGEGKPAKYLTPKGGTNRLYFPPLPFNEAHIDDAGIPLIVTEGEKKGLKGAQDLVGVYAVAALPGVWCFKDKTNGRRLHPDLLRIAIKGRLVLIVFDSDAATNPSVALAEDSLAGMLKKVGASVFVLRLKPNEDGSKVGLDDYLATHSAETFCALAGESVAWTSTLRLLEAAKQRATAPVQPLDLGLLTDHALLRQYLDYVRPLTDAVDEYHVFTFLTTVGTALGPAVYYGLGGQRLCPNFWVVLLGVSSLDRKTTALNFGRDFLRGVDPDLLLPDEGSPEGLLGHLQRHPHVLFAHSEFAAFLARLERSYMAGMKETLTDLYDCPPSYRRRLKDQDFTIRTPCISILAASTVEWFTSRLVEGDLRSGFLARYLYVPAPVKRRSLPLPPAADEAERQALVETLGALRSVEGEVTFHPGARAEYIAWYKRHESDLLQAEDRETLAGFYTRLESYVIKMATVLQVSRDRNLVIQPETLHGALHLVDYLKGNLRRLLADEFAFTAEMRDRKNVLKFIRANPGSRRSPILRYCHLTARRLDAALQTLRMEESIVEVGGEFFPQWPEETVANVRRP